MEVLNELLITFFLIINIIPWSNGLHRSHLVALHGRELKDNLGSDDPEGDMPVLLQTVLSRNPNIFREKSMPTRYGVQGGKEKTWRHCP